MSPLTKEHRTTLEKRVDYIAKDDDERVATGVVMVPDKVDLQGDFAHEGLIRDWATQFGNFYEAGEADGGIMHAAWPSNWMDLERNEVLDEAEEIGDETVEAGSWVQSWKYNDDELWSLVADGILSGRSIGAIDVTWSAPMDREELPDDVDIAEDYPEDDPVWEIQSGLMREVSDVDIPAVPDARTLTAAAKADAEKRLGDHLGNRDAFIEEALERGHSEEDAERLWSALHRAIDVDGAGEPGKQSAFKRLGKAVRDVLTLRSGTPPGRPGKKAAARDDGDATDEQADKNATGGDTPDETTMSNELDDPMADAPEWAKALHEQQQENSKRIDDALNGDGGEGDKDAFADAPDWAKALKEQQEKNSERIDQISKQTGTTESQQLPGTEKGGGDNEIDERAAFFTPESKMHELAAQSGGDRR